MLVPFLAILCSLKPAKETLALNSIDNSIKPDFTVMSYNVATFNSLRMENKQSDEQVNLSIYEWLRSAESPDILCMQEFYHSDLEDYDNTMDSIIRLGKYRYAYMNPVYKDEFKGVFGVVTFSKFRALKSGEIKYGDNPINKGVYHDFEIKDDTVRVLNFHLNSMSIRWKEKDSLSWFEQTAWNMKDMYSKLEKGYHQRKLELNEIEKFIDNSPYKIIICADLNSVPFSYSYQKFKARFENGFENAGFGLGYTINRFPWMVRIDNQFYDKKLKINYFKTITEMKSSDHYPIEAGYSFR